MYSASKIAYNIGGRSLGGGASKSSNVIWKGNERGGGVEGAIPPKGYNECVMLLLEKGTQVNHQDEVSAVSQSIIVCLVCSLVYRQLCYSIFLFLYKY